jgi:hypothetical protein
VEHVFDGGIGQVSAACGCEASVQGGAITSHGRVAFTKYFSSETWSHGVAAGWPNADPKEF